VRKSKTAVRVSRKALAAGFVREGVT